MVMEEHSETAVNIGPASGGIRRVLPAIKLLVTIGVSVWIVTYVDWPQFWGVLLTANRWVIALAALMLWFGLAVSSYKWQLVLRMYGRRFKLRRLVRLYLEAGFLNHFLPTSIGGDGHRIYKTWHGDGGKSSALLAVLIERVTGVAALLLLGYGAAVVTYLQRGDSRAGVIAVAGTAVLLGVLAALYLCLRYRLLQAVFRRLPWGDKLAGVIALIPDFRDHAGTSTAVGLISFIFHVNKILVMWLLLYSLGVVTNVVELTVVVVAVELIGLLPISLGGLGVVEGSFLFAAEYLGVRNEVALAAVLFLRVLVIMLSLVGAALYSMGDRGVRGGEHGDSESSPVAVPH